MTCPPPTDSGAPSQTRSSCPQQRPKQGQKLASVIRGGGVCFDDSAGVLLLDANRMKGPILDLEAPCLVFLRPGAESDAEGPGKRAARTRLRREERVGVPMMRDVCREVPAGIPAGQRVCREAPADVSVTSCLRREKLAGVPVAPLTRRESPAGVPHRTSPCREVLSNIRPETQQRREMSPGVPERAPHC